MQPPRWRLGIATEGTFDLGTSRSLIPSDRLFGARNRPVGCQWTGLTVLWPLDLQSILAGFRRGKDAVSRYGRLSANQSMLYAYLVCPSAYHNTTFHGVGGGMQQATPAVPTTGGFKGAHEASTPRVHIPGVPTVFADLTLPSSPSIYTMDPGTAIAISSLCAKVVSIIGKYYLDVQDAKRNVALLAHEVQTFGQVVREIAELSDANPRLPVSTSLRSAINQALSDAQSLQSKLDPGKTGKAMKRMGVRALTWPFTKKEVEEWVARFQRLTAIFNLALTTDQRSVVQACFQAWPS